METNLNCDLGETSIHHSAENDPDLMKLINTANIACGFHAGDEDTMLKSIELSKKYKVHVIDNFSGGRKKNLKHHNNNYQLKLQKIDICKLKSNNKFFKNAELNVR